MGRFHRNRGLTEEQQMALRVKIRGLAAAKRGLDYDPEMDEYICRECLGAFSSLEQAQKDHECDPNIDDEYGTFYLEDFISHKVKSTLVEREYAKKPIKDLCAITRNAPEVVSTNGVALGAANPVTAVHESIAARSIQINVDGQSSTEGKKAEMGNVGKTVATKVAIKKKVWVPKLTTASLPEQLPTKEVEEVVYPKVQFKHKEVEHDRVYDFHFIMGPRLDTDMKGVSNEELERGHRQFVQSRMEEDMHSHMKAMEVERAEHQFDPKDQRSYDRLKNKAGRRLQTSRLVSKVRKPIKSTRAIDSLIAFVAKRASRQGFSMDIVEKRGCANKLKFKKIADRQYLKVLTRHETGRFDRTDLYAGEFFDHALYCMKSVIKHERIDQEDIKPGWSGVVLNSKRIVNLSGIYMKKPHFVIRGRFGPDLVDARQPISKVNARKVEHYSDDFKNRFWRSFEETFIMLRKSKVHECVRDVPVEKFGQAVALFTQMLVPIFKTTCSQCIKLATGRSAEQIHFDASRKVVADYYETVKDDPDFSHYITAFELLSGIEKDSKIGLENFSKTNEIVMLAQTSQIKQIKDLNEILVKRHRISDEEFDRSSLIILELARWFKNRTDSRKAGALETFRNKISAKTHLNMALLCDNQLNVNGVFQWGERGYHAKRLFANFFDEIDESTSYEQYAIRKHIRGERHLAIKNLMVTTNLEKMRESMKGVEENRHQLSQACVTKIEGNFVYSCCCVTLDDGKPYESRVCMPTKHHLVLGSNLDEKVVKLPERVTSNMVIAKDGYCYITIFLAILINIQESDAKEYTQMVRDKVIKTLGKWPTAKDVATMLVYMRAFYPEIESAELPKILIDHTHKTMHVMDAFGSMSTNYHVLKANTVAQFIQFAYNEMQGELRDYNVGGDYTVSYDDSDGEYTAVDPHFEEITEVLEDENLERKVEFATHSEKFSNFKKLVSSMFNPTKFRSLLMDNPYYILFSLLSPTVVVRMYNDGLFDQAINIAMDGNMDVGEMMIRLKCLAQTVTMSESLIIQSFAIGSNCESLLEYLPSPRMADRVTNIARMHLEVLMQMIETDMKLSNSGFVVTTANFMRKKEDLYVRIYEDALHASGLRNRLRLAYYRSRRSKPLHSGIAKVKKFVSLDVWKQFTQNRLEDTRNIVRVAHHHTVGRVARCYTSICKRIVIYVFNKLYTFLSEIFKVVNLLILVSLLLQIYYLGVRICRERYALKSQVKQMEYAHNSKLVLQIYDEFYERNGGCPTKQEFLDHIVDTRPELTEFVRLQMIDVEFQHKRKCENDLERIVAVIAMIMMAFDSSRSDAVFKILNKLKSVFSTFNERVQFQSLDDEVNIDKGLTVDFDIVELNTPSSATFDVTFEDYWRTQLNSNRLCEHYRTTGAFIEFTRQRTEEVVREIAENPVSNNFLIRGPVGSGKSTGFPVALSAKGKVLILEPTRPLTENVKRQLSGAPFFQSVSMCMRGVHEFGSGNITVMTTGYALHYFANNRDQLNKFSFILLDECHVMDASAMAFYCLCKDMKYVGKILKTSATPPGRETDIDKSQKKIKLLKESSLSFEDFVAAQGTHSNACVVSHGANILVYVASYNEVDQLSNLLIARGYRVTKVDGRTMKSGSVDIEMKGSRDLPHFVVATNIIENGVTLDIDVVVDFGMKVVANLDADLRMINYSKIGVSFGERVQRLGRVGRTRDGVALRIGHTERGIQEVPEAVATEAALLCFAYGLPIMPHNVVVSALSKCTSQQARVIHSFELPPLFVLELVKEDGSMHPEIYRHLSKFILRDTEIKLLKTSLPNANTGRWFKVKDYKKFGARVALDDECKLPFYVNNVPDKLYEDVWNTCVQFKEDVRPARITTACAQKIAYTLQTDSSSIARTIGIIDHLLAEERVKQAHFRSAFSDTVSTSSFTIAGITKYLRSRYMHDHSDENIETLQRVRAQIMEFRNLSVPFSDNEAIRNYGHMTTVLFQSKEDITKHLGLKGKFDMKTAVHDGLVCTAVLVGGLCMIANTFYDGVTENVEFQGKRERQKLKFQRDRTNKMNRGVFDNDEGGPDNFAKEYLKKSKSKGRSGGSDTKARRFVHMYGFDPQEYSIVKFLDPLTGIVYDQNDFKSTWEMSDKIASDRLADDAFDRQYLKYKPEIHAYYFKEGSHKAIKIDLTQHNPDKIGKTSGRAVGFPSRIGEFRQTGEHVEIDISKIDERVTSQLVDFENKSAVKGLRNYSPISKVVCELKISSDGNSNTQFGIGFGCYIIANQHLFKRNNGTLQIKSAHGDFTVVNTTQLQVKPIENRDIIIIRMPKDFPPFPMKLNFREPNDKERVCLVGAEYTGKTVYTSVSESSFTYPEKDTHFWKYWVSTRHGQCGLPVVSVVDGSIVGLHSLCFLDKEENLYSAFPNNFDEIIVNMLDDNWQKNWKFNVDNIAWGSMSILGSKPEGLFRTIKEFAVGKSPVELQSRNDEEYTWLTKHIDGNLKHVGECPGNLITKHIVKGKCPLFSIYLQEHPEANEYFKPLMGFYGKSALNKAAYVQDLCKYSSTIIVNRVDPDVFEEAVGDVVNLLKKGGIDRCDYITDELTVIQDLNMNAAVGALYKGKKKDYFADFTEQDFKDIVRDSCERLYDGKFGIWNGSLKAELRSMEKVLGNKTRSFTAAPIETLLGGKVCVDDFNNAFYKAHLKIPSTVGITKFYKGWDNLLRSLPDGWIFCDADGSRFDSSLTPYLINSVITIREQFMEDWDIGKRMLRNLYTEIVYTPIATPDGSLLKKFKGNNSGQPSTVVDNTLMVMMAVQYALRRCRVDIEKQEEVIKYFCNGDDLILAIRPDKVSILDTFQESFDHLGLNYDFSSRMTNLTELSFMSHTGKLVEQTYIPKLDVERVVAILEWDRSNEPLSRLESLVAAMIEAWGYDELLFEIRKFYSWVLEQAPYKQLAQDGKAPYLAETALRRLYLDAHATEEELEKYYKAYVSIVVDDSPQRVAFQSDETTDAARQQLVKNKDKQVVETQKDVEGGSHGTFVVPRFKGISSKLKYPKFEGDTAVNLEHLLVYNPDQLDISNTRSTQQQFNTWYRRVMDAYGSDLEGMKLITNGLMVWCIENGTSMNLKGNWVMMDGETQVEYPISPLLEFAQPTFRQIMMHFSDLAEAYIEKRNVTERYMPRYGLQRNLRDYSAARVAFDFFTIKSSTSAKLREACIQMKAAAVKGGNNQLFGLDAKVGSEEEDTERHTADDVRRGMHSLQGARF